MPHFVHPKIDGGWLRLDFTCTEPSGADCKITCPPDQGEPYRCETFVVERDEDGTPWHIGHHFDFEGRLHQMIPTEYCNILTWWDDLAECYAGEPGPLREGPIVFTWTGDNYEWRYAE